MLSRPLTVLAVPAVLAALSTLAACGSETDEASDPSPAASASTPPEAEATESESGSAGDGSCQYAPDAGQPAKEVEPPPAEPTVSGEVEATIATSVGDLDVTLDAGKTPCTVNSFVSLAEQGYYDGSECHRIAMGTGFSMLQCGDPTASGTGGPGYTVPDELSGTETYPAGTIAMANTGQPNSGGGQFFLVFGDTQLPPSYTVFGTFDEAGIKLLEQVGAKGHDNRYGDGTGYPNEKVVFQEITVS